MSIDHSKTVKSLVKTKCSQGVPTELSSQGSVFEVNLAVCTVAIHGRTASFSDP
eukprot:Pgem_evm1s16346